MRTTPHQWPLEMSEVSSTVFGLERADFTREARLLDKVSGSVRDAVLGFGLMGVLRGLPKTATTQQVWDTIRESDQLVVVCEACLRDDVTATSLSQPSARERVLHNICLHSMRSGVRGQTSGPRRRRGGGDSARCQS